MFVVSETKTASKELDKAPSEILEAYEFWKNMVQISGVTGLKSYPGFKDHALKGEWQGARSSYLNRKWRVIYFSNLEEIYVVVVRVTPHDYRRK